MRGRRGHGEMIARPVAHACRRGQRAQVREGARVGGGRVSALGVARVHARAQAARLVGRRQVRAQWGSTEG
eukprot:6291680-Alexandrium_andersonii.AAC.1